MQTDPNDIIMLRFIKTNLGDIIKQAITERQNRVIYTEDWLAAIARRETGPLMLQQTALGIKPPDLWAHMLGDFTQRLGEPFKRFHGYGIWQRDIRWHAEFCQSEDWKDPLKCCKAAIEDLEQQRKYFISHPVPDTAMLSNAITAAYNTGAGNVFKSLHNGFTVDKTTAHADYAASVQLYREIYLTL